MIGVNKTQFFNCSFQWRKKKMAVLNQMSFGRRCRPGRPVGYRRTSGSEVVFQRMQALQVMMSTLNLR